MDNISNLKNKFVCNDEMEKDINDERVVVRLKYFRNEIYEEYLKEKKINR